MFHIQMTVPDKLIFVSGSGFIDISSLLCCGSQKHIVQTDLEYTICDQNINSLVYIKEVLVSFTSTELKILRLLLQYPQKIFSKQNLYESIWNKTYAYDDDTINTHISHIRKKIKAITNEDYIQTIWGIGYKIK